MKKPLVRITRRDTLKACLVPASAIAGGFLIGCSEDPMITGAPSAGSPAMPVTGAAGQPAGAAGAASTARSGAAGAVSAGAAGQTSPIAGSGASSSAAGAAGRGAAAPSSAGAGATAGSGGAVAGSGSPAAGSGGAPAGQAGASGGGAGTAAMPGANAGIAGPGVKWATGGTKSMKGGYPDPFEMGMAGAMCKLYPAQTLGPCYADSPAMREDISDGATGLPVRISFLVVRGACQPIPGASIDIWHSGFDGVYSAYAQGSVCNPGDMDVMNDMFCRGVQITNEQGRADFSTIFPGWYRGRAVHIHFTVRVNGMEEVTSQLYFDDKLITEIQSQGEYAPRGMRDTLNTNDMIFSSGGASPDQVVMSTAKRPDGVLHAWKILSIG